MITESLKTATRIPHAELEKTLVARIRGRRTRSVYRQLLELFYGFCKPLEEPIAPCVEAGYLPDFAERQKSAFILQDLQPLQGGHSQMLCTDLPRIQNASQSLGALYVLEGSTLGYSECCGSLPSAEHIPGIPSTCCNRPLRTLRFHGKRGRRGPQKSSGTLLQGTQRKNRKQNRLYGR